jgi:cobalt/nickel transport system permease protein
MVSIVILNDIIFLLIGLGIAIIFVLLSKIPIIFILKRLKWVVLFIFAVLIVLPFSVGSSSIFHFFFLTIYNEGLRLAVTIAIKALTVILLLFPMVATMKFVTFIKALEKLRLPNKLVQIITFTYRYIFVLLNELKRTILSIETRSYRKSTRVHKFRALSNAVGMLLVRSYERGQRIHNSMIARGYTGKIKTLDKFKMRSLDWVKAVSIITIAILIHFISYLNILNFSLV